MTIYEIGQKVNVATVLAVNGVPTNATMTIVVTAPDNSTSSPVINNPSTGNYNADVLVSMAGEWRIQWTATGAATSTDEYQIYVQPLGFRIVGLAEVKSHLNISASTNDNELLGFIDAAGDVVEAVCGPVRNKAVVEYRDGGSQTIVLRNWPVVSVTAITETWWGGVNYSLTQETDLGVGASTGFDFTFDKTLGSVTRRRSFWPWQFVPGVANIKITYVSGLPQPWPPSIRIAAMELVSWFWRSTQTGRGFPRAPVGGSQTTLVAGYAVPNPIIDTLLKGQGQPPMVGTG